MELNAFENQSERRTRRILTFATADTLYWVNAKTRLEDVFTPSRSDPEDERRFLRDAHFDYTLHRQSSNTAIWAFEFDGPGHRTDPDAIRRDILKNRICAKANLPILRIEDELLEAIDGISLLEWLIKRWMIHKRIIPGMISERNKNAAAIPEEEWDALQISEGLFSTPPELDVDFLFNLNNPYPPLQKTSTRLLNTYGIREGLSLELDPNWREMTAEVTWELSTEGPLPDLANHGMYSRSFCEVELRRAGESWPSKPRFATTGEYMARIAYPTFPNQRTPFDLNPKTKELGLCGPPHGGSLWAAGPQIAWHKALMEVEKWAAKNLPRVPPNRHTET
ncbi:DUF2726 domain-containing protein [Streptomyces sp. NPDC059897]|uniref:DUF2726 domain-containing protein n=1 Tax=Streptomyces sp. NPDC059897 TaxID=3346994 RepID=UPI00365F51BB